MQRWRQDTKAKTRLIRSRATIGTFRIDAKRYLQAKAAAPDLKNLTRTINLWVAEFGNRRRDAIRPAEIAAVRDRWLTEGRPNWHGTPPAPPLSPHTVNLRLRALSNLYRTLDGKQSYNPVRDVTEAKEPQPAPRLLDYDTIRRLIEAIPDQGRELRKGHPRPTVSLTKIRLRVLAYTGLPASLLMALTADDLNLDAQTMRVPARQKGSGAPGATLPLIPPAVDAFRDLIAHGALGRFSTSSLHKSWMLAARKLKLTGIRPYDLRHAFALTVYDVTGDLDLVMALLRHRDIRTSERYRQAILERVWQRKAEALHHAFRVSE